MIGLAGGALAQQQGAVGLGVKLDLSRPHRILGY